MNKKRFVFVMIVILSVLLQSCSMPAQQMNGEVPAENMQGEMPIEPQPQEMMEDPDAMPPEEMPQQEMEPEEWYPEELDPNREMHIVDFLAQPPEIMAGDCTLLEWYVEGEAEIFMNGMNVGHADTYQDCPMETTHYVLIANSGQGEEVREVTVLVHNEGQPNPPAEPNTKPTEKPTEKPQANPPSQKVTSTPTLMILQAMITDLAVDKIYPSASGKIMVRVKNVGTEQVSNNISLNCKGLYTTQKDHQVWPSDQNKTITIKLNSGQYADYETGFARNPDMKTLQVSCKIVPPAADFITANNELNNVKVK